MNRKAALQAVGRLFLLTLWGFLALIPGKAQAQYFDFESLREITRPFTVVIDMKLELSYGIHTSDQHERYLGAIVTEDGLVLFNGTALGGNALTAFSPVSIKTTPTKIEVTTLDGKKYDGKYLGVDRFTQIGFIRIVGNENFTPVKFPTGRTFRIGEWLTLYMLLPEFVNPPLSADVGMVSSVVKSPEYFPLTVGFSPLQMASVMFDENLEPVGVLGVLPDPSRASTGVGGMLESFGQFGVPMLGVIVGEQLEKLISDPPLKGQPDRGWLGITLQALKSEMAQFWNLDISGGIIVNDIVSKSPAEKAGLKVGDIIYKVNGRQVEVDKEETLPVFQRLIAELGPGTSVELSVLRGAGLAPDTLTLIAELEKAPLAAAESPTYEIKTLEFKVRNLVFADYLFHNLDPNTFSGVVVAELKRGGLADVGGLQLGDVIQRIENAPTTSIDEVRAVMESMVSTKPREVIFFVWRDNKTLFVNIKTDWK